MPMNAQATHVSIECFVCLFGATLVACKSRDQSVFTVEKVDEESLCNRKWCRLLHSSVVVSLDTQVGSFLTRSGNSRACMVVYFNSTRARVPCTSAETVSGDHIHTAVC